MTREDCWGEGEELKDGVFMLPFDESWYLLPVEEGLAVSGSQLRAFIKRDSRFLVIR